MSFLSKSKPIMLSAVLTAAASVPAAALDMTEKASIKIGDGEGYAEMIRYHAPSQSLFVTACETDTLERISMANPSALGLATPFDLDGGNVTAVAVHGDLAAASIKADAADAPGEVKLYDTNGTLLASYPTGALPDNVAFSPDGRYMLTANEGEPSDD